MTALLSHAAWRRLSIDALPVWIRLPVPQGSRQLQLRIPFRHAATTLDCPDANSSLANPRRVWAFGAGRSRLQDRLIWGVRVQVVRDLDKDLAVDAGGGPKH